VFQDHCNIEQCRVATGRWAALNNGRFRGIFTCWKASPFCCNIGISFRIRKRAHEKERRSDGSHRFDDLLDVFGGGCLLLDRRLARLDLQRPLRCLLTVSSNARLRSDRADPAACLEPERAGPFSKLEISRQLAPADYGRLIQSPQADE
jgi:hypothetical protein